MSVPGFLTVAIGAFISVNMGQSSVFNGLASFHGTETIEGIRRVVIGFVETQGRLHGLSPNKVQLWAKTLSYDIVAERVNLRPIDIICATRWGLFGASISSLVLLPLVWVIPDLPESAATWLCIVSTGISLVRAAILAYVSVKLQGFAALRETAAPWRLLT